MNRKLVANSSVALVLLFVSVSFLACHGFDEPTKPLEMTTEQKKTQEGLEALRAKKAEYTAIPDKERLAKEPYRNKKLIFLDSANRGKTSRANG